MPWACFKLLMIVAALLMLCGALNAPPHAFAQAPLKKSSCAKSKDISNGSLGISGSFACVAELDGDGNEQTIVGNVSGSSGYVVILNSNGTIRKIVCWASGAPTCPTFGGTLQVSPAAGTTISGRLGGPFAPASFGYQLSANAGNAFYSISGLPNWLTPSSTSGTVTTSPTTVTFSLNANANSLGIGSYVATITFTNTGGGDGTQSRVVRLDVLDPTQRCSQEAMVCPDGSVVTRTGLNCAFASCPTPGNPPAGSRSPSAPIPPSRAVHPRSFGNPPGR
jgi:hypothetical protein